MMQPSVEFYSLRKVCGGHDDKPLARRLGDGTVAWPATDLGL